MPLLPPYMSTSCILALMHARLRFGLSLKAMKSTTMSSYFVDGCEPSLETPLLSYNLNIMASVDPENLTEDQLDDLLYFARAGELDDLRSTIHDLSSSLPLAPAGVLAAAVDPDSGNTILHMASANGHVGAFTSCGAGICHANQ